MKTIREVLEMPMSPSQIDAISGPAEQKAIGEINMGLARGKRIFMMDDGILPQVCDAFETMGWEIDRGRDMGIGGRTVLFRVGAKASQEAT